MTKKAIYQLLRHSRRKSVLFRALLDADSVNGPVGAWLGVSFNNQRNVDGTTQGQSVDGVLRQVQRGDYNFLKKIS